MRSQSDQPTIKDSWNFLSHVCGRELACLIYSNSGSVRNAIETLQREGFRLTDISVLFPHNEGTKDFSHESTGALIGRRQNCQKAGASAIGPRIAVPLGECMHLLSF